MVRQRHTFTLLETKNGVAKITFNRPEVLNSFNRAMADEVQVFLLHTSTLDEVRAVLITGAGKAFCAGQDLGEFAEHGDAAPKLADVVRTQFNPIVRLLRSFEKPVVCALNGVAAGAGANIALACDFIIAAESASFVQSFSRIGLVPDTGGTYFLPRLVGMLKATQLVMLGEKVTSSDALAFGLLYRVVSDELLQSEAEQFAQKLASMPTKALGLTKRALNQSLSSTLEDQLELEAQLQEVAGLTEDFSEGVRAFIEKRKPIFKGK